MITISIVLLHFTPHFIIDAMFPFILYCENAQVPQRPLWRPSVQLATLAFLDEHALNVDSINGLRVRDSLQG